jgi:ketosteroid isomerase-like protein
MPTVATESFNQQWFRRVWNNLEASAIDELMTPDCIIHGLAAESTIGPAAFHEVHARFTQAFRDIQIEVLREVSNGTMHSAYCRVAMISRADGRSVEFHGCPMIRVAGGRMVEAWNTWDFLSLAQAMETAPVDALPRALQAPVDPPTSKPC